MHGVDSDYTTYIYFNRGLIFLYTSVVSIFSQKLAEEAEKLQKEHVWREDSEVSERLEPDLMCSLTLDALRTHQVLTWTP